MAIAHSGQAIATVFLGILNLVGVGYLSSLVQSPQAAALQLSSSSVSIILGSLPFLQAKHPFSTADHALLMPRKHLCIAADLVRSPPFLESLPHNPC